MKKSKGKVNRISNNFQTVDEKLKKYDRKKILPTFTFPDSNPLKSAFSESETFDSGTVDWETVDWETWQSQR